jgi:gamma-glutamyltranspeptidase/glutathione hydrolase
MFRNFHAPGRSPARSMNGMVATSHPLASTTALEILREGGNAVDAAVAASAVLSVVEPQMTGIGGDLFAIIAEPDGSLHGLNGSGRAPRAIDPDELRAQGLTTIAQDSPYSITTPGTVKAWDALLKIFGSLSLDTLLVPAISIAEKGHPVCDRVASDWSDLVPKLLRDEGAQKHLLIQGRAPKAGEVHTQAALGVTLRMIAEAGPSAFYEGAVADDIITTVRRYGGRLDYEDLAMVSADPLEPVTSTYRGVTVAELPPNGQGIVALLILKILEQFECEGLDPCGPERLHLEMEAARLAYAVRDAHIADPDAMQARVSDLLSESHINHLVSCINLGKRNEDIVLPDLPDSDTVYLSVGDAEGRLVSFIHSIYKGFGSGIVTPATGITLQNRGACFNLKKGHVNEIGPGKRPMHTIIPAIALKRQDFIMSFGVMGGAYQPCGHAHVISNMTDFGMDVQQAIDAPRIFWDDNGILQAENTLSESCIEGLERRGHKVKYAKDPWGGGQIVMRSLQSGAYTGASDHRKDGCAIGY